MQQPQNSFLEYRIQRSQYLYTEVQSYKFLFLRDVKITLEVAAETEIILDHFQNDKTIQQLALNKMINQINNSNKIHLELQSEVQQKDDSFKLKVLNLRKETRELFDILMDQFDNDQVRGLLYKYTDHNLEDTVNPFWQLITQVKLNEIPEQQMNFLKAINKKGETLRTLSGQIYTEQQIKKCIDEKKAFIKEQIQLNIYFLIIKTQIK